MRTKWLWLAACWLLVSVVAAVLLAGMLFGFETLQRPVFDIQMHNTYFVMSRTSLVGWLLVPVLLVSGIVILLLRRRSIWLHLLLAMLSALLSTVASRAACTLGTMGWTIYPPLSMQPHSAEPTNPYQHFLISAYALQLLALLFFGYNCYRVGKLSAVRKLESTGGA
jgi:heme/copper-type cytochrome/quinol oxidase subunit 1